MSSFSVAYLKSSHFKNQGQRWVSHRDERKNNNTDQAMYVDKIATTCDIMAKERKHSRNSRRGHSMSLARP